MQPDRFNRQLRIDTDPHRDERTLAKQLAEKSGGKYTQERIEDQMRIMGVIVDGKHQSGAPETLIGEVPTDSGSNWIHAGTTSDGKPVLTQVTAKADAELQSYILANYNSVGKDQLPSVFGYDRPKNNDWGFELRGPFTQMNAADVEFMRTTTADTMSMVSTTAGRFSAAAAAAAEIPSPYSSGFAAAALAGTVASYGASAVEQHVRPDPVGFAVDSTIDLLLYRPTEKIPLLGPAINEAGNSIKNSDWANRLKRQGDNGK